MLQAVRRRIPMHLSKDYRQSQYQNRTRRQPNIAPEISEIEMLSLFVTGLAGRSRRAAVEFHIVHNTWLQHSSVMRIV